MNRGAMRGLSPESLIPNYIGAHNPFMHGAALVADSRGRGFMNLWGMRPVANALAFGLDRKRMDNDVPINAAIAYLGPQGGDVLIPGDPDAVLNTSTAATVYNINKSINLGNGTASTPSTFQGVRLCGMAANAGGHAVLSGGFPAPAVALQWQGPTAQPMVWAIGPLAGWGIEALTLLGNNVATYGLLATSASFGRCQNLHVRGCQNSIYQNTVVGTGSLAGAPLNCSLNRYEDCTIECPSGGAGGSFSGLVIGLDFDATASPLGNSSFNIVDNLVINMLAGGTGNAHAIHLKGCDSNEFRSGLIESLNVANMIAVFFDYGTTGKPEWPAGNMFLGLDLAGSNSYQSLFANSGTAPGAGATPNYMLAPPSTNKKPENPRLANLVFDVTIPASTGVPTIAAGAAASAVTQPSGQSNDLAGRFTATTVATPTNNTQLCTITFGNTYGSGNTPKAITLSVNTHATVELSVIPINASAASFAVQFLAGSGSITYTISYHVDPA